MPGAGLGTRLGGPLLRLEQEQERSRGQRSRAGLPVDPGPGRRPTGTRAVTVTRAVTQADSGPGRPPSRLYTPAGPVTRHPARAMASR